ncbi:puratrophin-1-like isoform X3 [Acanthaster planci]|uniref:Puratrophin-1-like isoform X3 n=1 Tax=Acanthaster planci TaxID=133434 RepID=A0A8B7YHY9_ACAPL|nr:puratrophin-1-like isoform X3 [Acanthaster planci]
MQFSDSVFLHYILSQGSESDYVDLDMQDILSELYQPFDMVAPYLLSQVCRVMDRHYDGDGIRFLQEFLLPTRAVLLQLKEDSWLQLKHKPRDDGWPLCYHGNVVVHLCEVEREYLRQGDYYLYIKPNSPPSPANNNNTNSVTLTLQYLNTDGQLREIPVPTSTFREVFTRHWLRDASRDVVPSASSSAMDLSPSSSDGGACSGSPPPRTLSSCLIAGELGLQREEWRDIVQPPVMERRLSGRRSKTQRSRVGSSGSGSSNGGMGQHGGAGKRRQMKPMGMREMRKSGSGLGSSGSDDSSRQGNSKDGQLLLAQYILEVNFELLHSQAVILTGARDSRGGAVLEVQGDSPIWTEAQYSLHDISKVIGYLFGIPREEVRTKGLTVAVDARSSPKSAVEIIAESLQVLEESYPGAIHQTTVLIDSDSVLSRFITSHSKPKVNYKCEVVHSVDKLHQFVAASLLTKRFSGSFPYDHDSWVRFRMKLEPFISGCQSAAKFLLASMEDFTMTGTPQSAVEISEAIETVRHKHEDVYQDARLAGLHREGDGILATLQNQEGPLALTEDFQDAMICVSTLFDQVHQACTQLDELADRRLSLLNQRLQLAVFEEQTADVTEWMSKEGDFHLGQMKEEKAESLGSIHSIQKDFEKFYFTAMKHIGRGEDLLEDAQGLAEACEMEQAGIREIARTLRHQLKLFTDRLEDKRRYIEDAARLYTMLDKAYEWALDGMKFVAVLGHEKSNTREQCRIQLCTLEKYLRDNPPTAQDDFVEMCKLSKQLGKEQCIQQCDFAKRRCQETHGMMQDKMDKLHGMLRSPRSSSKLGLEWGDRNRTERDETVYERSSSVTFDAAGSLTPQKGTQGGGQDSEGPFSKAELLRKGSRSAPPKQHRDSLHSNGSVDSGISVGDKILDRGALPISPTSMDSPNEFSVRQRKMAALIKPISEIVDTGKRTSSLEKLDEGYEEAETNVVRRPTQSVTHPVVEPKRSYSMMLSRKSEDVEDSSEEKQDRVCRKANMEDEFQLSDEETPDGTETHWSPKDANRHIRKSVSQVPGTPLKLEELTSNAGLLGNKEHPNYRRMVLILDEMIQTEQDYVLALKYIIENYFPEMDRDDIPQGLRGQRSAVFGNLEKIYEFHDRHFLKALSQCQSDPLQVCHCFLQHKKGFGLYALYNKNKPRSDSLLADYGGFFRTKQRKIRDRMDLASYLLKPVQRLGKYALLLRDLIRECRPSDQELASLKSAEEMVQFQMRHGNDLLAMDSIKDCDVDLHEQGELLRQDEFLVYRGHRKCVRHVFLFEDMILFSKTRRTARGHDVYHYKFSLKMTDIGMTENIGESGLKLEIWFRRRKTTDKAYILHARSNSIKQAWTQDISKLLWRQAFRSKEARQAQLSSMGVGSKPCLDIKPNEDRINDRAINMRHRAPRMRNSIAISSFSPSQLLNPYTFSSLSLTSTSLSTSPARTRRSIATSSSAIIGASGTTKAPHAVLSRPLISNELLEECIAETEPGAPVQNLEDTLSRQSSDSGSVFTPEEASGSMEGEEQCVKTPERPVDCTRSFTGEKQYQSIIEVPEFDEGLRIRRVSNSRRDSNSSNKESF